MAEKQKKKPSALALKITAVTTTVIVASGCPVSTRVRAVAPSIGMPLSYHW